MPYTNETLVQNAARNIIISSGKTATMTSGDATQFINEADQIINSKLSTLYYTPLQQITRTAISNTPFYPDPIPYIATRIAAALMVRSVFSRIEPQVSENAEAHLADALRELDDLYKGVAYSSRRLQGQILKAKTPFLNPYAAPLEPPQS